MKQIVAKIKYLSSVLLGLKLKQKTVQCCGQSQFKLLEHHQLLLIFLIDALLKQHG